MNPLQPESRVQAAFTRRSLIAAGLLVDVTDAARASGFYLPVALSRVVWDLCVDGEPRDSLREPDGAAQERLSALLDLAIEAARNGFAAMQPFQATRAPASHMVERPVDLLMHLGKDEDGVFCITIMVSA